MSVRLQGSRRTSVLPSRILIVEEDADTRLMLKYLLEIWNYQVIEAKNDDEAFQMAIHYCPDLILISINTGETNGFATSQRMREISTLEQAVIIFVSASSDEKTRASALASGGNDYIVKPIDFGVLEKTLESHLTANAKL
jgi:two-component system alkaline phosphatase synthesis response regulator PhoP